MSPSPPSLTWYRGLAGLLLGVTVYCSATILCTMVILATCDEWTIEAVFNSSWNDWFDLH